MAQEVLAGAAEAKITPPLGTEMSGFASRDHACSAIRDDLYARALVVEGAGQALGLVVVDLLGLSFEQVAEIRAAVAQATAIAEEALMICATHTHNGPAVAPLRGMGQPQREYVQRTLKTVAATVRRAWERRAPCALAWGRKHGVRIGANRRERQPDGTFRLGVNPEGPYADHVDALCVLRDGAPAAVFAVHAAHPVTLGAESYAISAEWCGAAARFIRRKLGNEVIALVTTGCCGNVNCNRRGDREALLEENGRIVGAAAAEICSGAAPGKALPLGAKRRVIGLPAQPLPSEAEAQGQLEVARKTLRDARAAGKPGRIRWAEAYVQWAEEVLRLVRAGARREPERFEIHALRLGELAVVGLSGEVFVEYQLEIDRTSPFAQTIVCGTTNGCVGYVPTAQAFGEGGYEVEQAYKFYDRPTMLAPECEGVLLEAVKELLAEMR